MRPEHGFEAQESRVDCAADGRRNDQLNLRVVGKVLLQIGTLLFAQVCKVRIAQGVVRGAQIMIALCQTGKNISTDRC